MVVVRGDDVAAMMVPKKAAGLEKTKDRLLDLLKVHEKVVAMERMTDYQLGDSMAAN